MVVLELVRNENVDHVIKVDLDEEVLCGRGPLLGVDSTSISRKHVKIKWDRNLVLLTCLHRNPVFVKKTDSDWSQLDKDQDIELDSGDKFKFDDEFIFSVVSIIATQKDKEPLDVRTDCLKEDNSEDSILVNVDNDEHNLDSSRENEKDIENVAPVPTGLKVKKKRKLPDWMLEDKIEVNKTPTKVAKKSPVKQIKDQNDSKSPSKPIKPTLSEQLQNNYNKNIEFITGKPINEKNFSTNEVKPKIIDKFEVNSREENKLSNVVSKRLSPVKDKNDPPSCEPSTSTKRSPMLITTLKEDNKPFTFPVLVTEDDLVDSDDEPDKENKNSNTPINTSETTEKANRRPSCQYGSSCYRKNPVHRHDEAHPGDHDYQSPDDVVGANDDRPECEYGTDCYRQNPAHRKDYKHSHKPQPKRKAKAKAAKKKKDDDDLDDSFIDDDEEESFDDTDDDEDWNIPSDDE